MLPKFPVGTHTSISCPIGMCLCFTIRR